VSSELSLFRPGKILAQKISLPERSEFELMMDRRSVEMNRRLYNAFCVVCVKEQDPLSDEFLEG